MIKTAVKMNHLGGVKQLLGKDDSDQVVVERWQEGVNVELLLNARHRTESIWRVGSRS